MHVGQVSHLYRPSIGGIENYVTRVNESLQAAGHVSTTFTTDMSLENGHQPADGPGNVHYCRTTGAVLRNPLSIELYRSVRRSDFDVYHLHNPWLLPTLEAAHAVPDDAAVVMTVHSAEIKNNSWTISALNSAYKPFANYIFEAVDHNFVQGETEKHRLLNRFDVGSEDVSVLPNGIRPDDYEVPAESVVDFEADHGLDPDVPTVLYVSRLIPEKNPGVLVDAVEKHLEEQEVQVLVIGDGEPSFVEPLRRRAGNRVQFCPTLPFEELKAAYHAADLFVFLGTWEGLPTVILEAMNAATPIISTPVGAIPDTVTDPDNGRLVESPPKPAAVAAAITEFLEDPELRRAVGERNRKRVRSEYRWSDIAADIIDRYEREVHS